MYRIGDPTASYSRCGEVFFDLLGGDLGGEEWAPPGNKNLSF